jgi:hypothetical protein
VIQNRIAAAALQKAAQPRPSLVDCAFPGTTGMILYVLAKEIEVAFGVAEIAEPEKEEVAGFKDEAAAAMKGSIRRVRLDARAAHLRHQRNPFAYQMGQRALCQLMRTGHAQG